MKLSTFLINRQSDQSDYRTKLAFQLFGVAVASLLIEPIAIWCVQIGIHGSIFNQLLWYAISLSLLLSGFFGGQMLGTLIYLLYFKEKLWSQDKWVGRWIFVKS